MGRIGGDVGRRVEAGGLDSPTAIITSKGMRRLETALLLRAYAAGMFPMADARDADDVFWVEPRRRGILPLDSFHLSRSLAKTLRHERFRHSHDRAFATVIDACAAAAPGRPESWINSSIADAYLRLHHEGHAHSVETWDADGQLVGGLYGVQIGAAFFGESMFSRATDASKAALAHLVARLKAGGFRLLDTQFLTTHLESLGAIEVRRAQYRQLLSAAIASPADWTVLDRLALQSCPVAGGGRAGGAAGAGVVLPDDGRARARVAPAGGRDVAGGPSGKWIVQFLSQTS